ncbi:MULTISPECIES: hypothetical protein [Curtobacterium]|uniref:hypothetical protein n=1 Tax=Curtobacterium TaxID=2034 RepID=UPI000487A2C0|nr:MULTISPECIES: hypothetical protein [Curtobacterium]MBT1582872.1 hypothetical protein [Curtobacterium flaccumfaciens pv. flaccumfaciens]MBT1633802.1 hypothetical protein [Curtobacterium flaccumfaciens pv. oortii]MBT1667774.1 hypothetical protein [Curtobacterium flaccumfaciens pv. flaccumfaciens]MCS5492496.1 hypothetical protein [Curtobacterium flaccumfaciens pv. flaccumfaciens]MCS5505314.1 hypothetical protein [Curtobacterium flaccumfaciens pv. flaccumfaciens]
MNETESVETVITAPSTGFVSRLRFRLRAEQEIHELTRDRELEERVRAEAAVRLAPGPWHLGELFRRR